MTEFADSIWPLVIFTLTCLGVVLFARIDSGKSLAGKITTRLFPPRARPRLRFSRVATELIYGCVVAHPHLAKSFRQAMNIVAQEVQNPPAHDWEARYASMTSLAEGNYHPVLSLFDWIVPGNPKSVRWNASSGKDCVVSLEVTWENGMGLSDFGLFIPDNLIPTTISSTLAGRKFGDITDIPVYPAEHVLRDEDLTYRNDGVWIFIGRSETTFGEVEKVMGVVTLRRTIPGLEITRRYISSEAKKCS